MGMMKRVHWDNVVQLFPARADAGGAGGWWWMQAHAEWWDEKGQFLDWKPIASYEVLDASMALASPVILRDVQRWVYGALIDGVWHQVMEGGSYPLDDFEPDEWADVELDDAILLSQE